MEVEVRRSHLDHGIPGSHPQPIAWAIGSALAMALNEAGTRLIGQDVGAKVGMFAGRLCVGLDGRVVSLPDAAVEFHDRLKRGETVEVPFTFEIEFS